MMIRSRTLVILVAVLGFLCIAATADAQPRLRGRSKVLGVASFVNKSGSRLDPGTALKEKLMVDLLQEGVELVDITPGHVQQAMEQLGLSVSDFGNPEFAKAIGELVAADVLLYGDITRFEAKTTKKLGVGFTTTTVELVGLLVEVETLRYLDPIEVKKDHRVPEIPGDVEGLGLDIFGKAIDSAIKEMAKKVREVIPEAPWSAEIGRQQSGEIFIRAGSDDGVTEDMLFRMKETETILDENGDVIDEEEYDRGIWSVVRVRGKTTVIERDSAEGEFDPARLVPENCFVVQHFNGDSDG